jgi:hypothetical protein
MRKAARIAGIVWMAAILVSGIALMGSGVLRGGRGNMLVLFGAALPGVFLFRWGKRA